MAYKPELDALSNPLANVEQLSNSSSRIDGIPPDLESSIRYRGALLTQAAGVLLRLPQETIAQAIVIFTRFYTVSESGSFLTDDAADISAASIYLMAKLSFDAQPPRSIINVYAYLASINYPFYNPPSSELPSPKPEEYIVSEADYQRSKERLFHNESNILRFSSFTTRVTLPHHLALTYLQTLGVLPSEATSESAALAQRTIAHLNTALLSPQLLYLTHQPPALAVTAIYLAAREMGVSLVRTEWWEVFDVDREELGFLVVAMQSMRKWADAERLHWAGRSCPHTRRQILEEIRRIENGGDVERAS